MARPPSPAQVDLGKVSTILTASGGVLAAEKAMAGTIVSSDQVPGVDVGVGWARQSANGVELEVAREG